MTRPSAIEWPDGKRFAFTVFDDPDGQRLEVGRKVYTLLRDLGFRTTKGVWPLAPERPVDDTGGNCSDPAYLAWVNSLQRDGFEIGFHNAACHTSSRARTDLGLRRFRELFGAWPRTMSNHYNSREGIYFGDRRLSGLRRLTYNALTAFRNRKRYRGHVEGDELFWGDLCRERVSYVRNFVFTEIDTLSACPYIPYHDPARPYVRAWYASSEGNDCARFVEQIGEERQDRLAESGGACIMYTHFGHRFVENGELNPRFRALMERMADRDGWFVPVGELLDHIRSQRGVHTLKPRERRRLERSWLVQKVASGTR